MSLKVMTWAFGTDLQPAAKLVLLALADNANDEGFAWPKQTTLAAKTSMTTRSVIRHLRYLAEAGLLTIHSRATQNGRKTNMYEIHVGAEFSLGSQQSDKLSLCETDPNPSVDNFPVENSETETFPCDSSNVTDCHFADENGLQGDTCVTLQSDNGVTLLPYIEPSIEPPFHTNGAPVDNSVVVDGVESLPSMSDPDPVPYPQTEPDWDLIHRALPDAMVALLGRSGGLRVTQILRRSQRAGWDVSQIRYRMNTQLPAVVKNGAGLVIHRLNDVVLAPVPVSDLAQREDFIERARAEVERIVDGESALPVRDQWIRLSSLLNNGDVVYRLGDLVGRAQDWLLAVEERA